MKINTSMKKEFLLHFTEQMKEETFMDFFYEIFVIGSAYVVGGYFRDFLLKKESRDIDIITDIDSKKLEEFVIQSKCIYDVNRYGGIKIKLRHTEIDIWSISNNWAFKNKLVKLNENNILESIAKGCFYNYDALVINLHNGNCCVKYFEKCIQNRELDILLNNSLYKNLNPSIEANILRALFISKYLGFNFSEKLLDYLYMKIGTLYNSNVNAVDKIIQVRNNYPKYQKITFEDIDVFIRKLGDQFQIKRFNLKDFE